jgi:hypothetical protein
MVAVVNLAEHGSGAGGRMSLRCLSAQQDGSATIPECVVDCASVVEGAGGNAGGRGGFWNLPGQHFADKRHYVNLAMPKVVATERFSTPGS